MPDVAFAPAQSKNMNAYRKEKAWFEEVKYEEATPENRAFLDETAKTMFRGEYCLEGLDATLREVGTKAISLAIATAVDGYRVAYLGEAPRIPAFLASKKDDPSYPSVASVAEGYRALLNPTSARLIGSDSLGAPRRLAATAKAFYDAGAPDEAEWFQRAAWDVLKRFYGEPYQTQATEHAEAIETLRRLPKQLGDEEATLLLFDENDPVKQEAKRKAREEAERKAKEEAEREAREEAERKTKEEAERKVRKEAERKVKAEGERKSRKDAKRKAKTEAEWELELLEELEREEAECIKRQFNSAKTAGTRKALKIKGVEFAFRWCPPGTFLMGSPASEADRHDNETRHKVTLTKGVWMLETSVTQGMYCAIFGSNPSCFKWGNYPVESVSWFDCQSFCKVLNALGVAPAGYAFRLPTEAEWEYACRAGTNRPYFWGSTLNGDKANCKGDYPYGGVSKGRYLKKSSAVGSYIPNAWGLYDMHGNVYDWCVDWFGDYDAGPQTDPMGPSKGSCRVLRGGSWYSGARSCRSASRNSLDPTSRNNYCGFRLALGREF